jgi:hypothetical protein
MIFRWKSGIGQNGSRGEFNSPSIEGSLPTKYTANEFPMITQERFKGSEKSICSWDPGEAT